MFQAKIMRRLKGTKHTPVSLLTLQEFYQNQQKKFPHVICRNSSLNEFIECSIPSGKILSIHKLDFVSKAEEGNDIKKAIIKTCPHVRETI